MNWIKVSEKLPKNNQEVLTVYYDKACKSEQYSPTKTERQSLA